MKAKTSTAKKTKVVSVAGLKAKKETLERGERAAGRVFKFETLPDGSMRRVEVNPETHRRKVAKDWKAKTEVARARQTLNLTQDAFAGLLGISLSTLRSWEQGKREPSGAARTLVHIALKHPEVLREEVR
jgi:DNA-binding transcriptional regulator YiaG